MRPVNKWECTCVYYWIDLCDLTHVVEAKKARELAMAGTSSSQLFCPFRAVGFVSNHVPLVTTCRGPDNFVLTAVGKSYHQYKVVKLSPLPLRALYSIFIFLFSHTV